MSRRIYINGELVPQEEAKISVFDTDCCTATACSRDCAPTAAKCSGCAEHVVRLYESAKAIWLEIPMSQDAMCDAIDHTVAANGISDGYVRAVVTAA